MSKSEFNSKFFQNRDCEYFPCHEIEDVKNFNCLFCYCPLYALENRCGGKYIYNDKGIKVCTKCSFPHRRENYPKVLEKLKILINEISKNKG